VLVQVCIVVLLAELQVNYSVYCSAHHTDKFLIETVISDKMLLSNKMVSFHQNV